MRKREHYDTATAVPSTNNAPDDSPYKADIEAAVLRIWTTLLQLEHVELMDNFLLLGGESLLATQAASRIKEQFGYDLSIRSIFTKSIEQIVTEIAANRSKSLKR